MAAPAPMWTSNLGHKFPKELIDRLDSKHHFILQTLRAEPCNAHCAECGAGETAWASVSLGVFLCLRCADVHRALGTHISRVKGCSGTYLWGPDEIVRMQEVGNAAAEALYGGAHPEAKPAQAASKEERVALCRQKYEQRLWARPSACQRPAAAALYRGAGSPAAAAAPSAASEPDAPAAAPAAQVVASAHSCAAARGSKPAAAARPGGSACPDELFKDFDVPCDAKPVEVLHQSQWWVGSGPPRPSGTPSSTAASEGDLGVFLERCFSDPELVMPARPATAPQQKQAAALPEGGGRQHPADSAKLWADFGAW